MTGEVRQFARACAAGGALGWAEFACVLVLLACGAVAVGVAVARRAQYGQVPGLPGDGDPLSQPERVRLAEIERHYTDDGKKRMVTRKRRTVRKAATRTGKR